MFLFCTPRRFSVFQGYIIETLAWKWLIVRNSFLQESSKILGQRILAKIHYFSKKNSHHWRLLGHKSALVQYRSSFSLIQIPPWTFFVVISSIIETAKIQKTSLKNFLAGVALNLRQRRNDILFRKRGFFGVLILHVRGVCTILSNIQDGAFQKPPSRCLTEIWMRLCMVYSYFVNWRIPLLWTYM